MSELDNLMQTIENLSINEDAKNKDTKNDISINLLEQIVIDNNYVKDCKSNKKKDKSSLSYLVEKSLSQSECIKLGKACESIFEDTVIKFTKLTNIKPKNKKGKKEKDLLFLKKDEKIIYYCEAKGNINLDTEKSKSTYKKCLHIVEELKQQYPDHTINWCLLSVRYIDNSEIPEILKHKYQEIKDNLFGINEFLEMFNINFKFTKETYKKYINLIADKMVS